MEITITLPDDMVDSIEKWLDSPSNLFLQGQPNGETRNVRRMQSVEEVINHVVASYGASKMVEHPPQSLSVLVEQQEAARVAVEAARKETVDKIKVTSRGVEAVRGRSV